MKKLLLVLLVFVVSFAFAGCFVPSGGFRGMGDNDEMAQVTCDAIVHAIEQKDAASLAAVFSKNAQDEQELSQNAQKLMEYIRGDIQLTAPVSESGIGAHFEKDKGKKRKEIQPSFYIVTTEAKYHIAFKECVRDDFDKNNEGVFSLYLIESRNWIEDYVFRGDGTWSEGIHVLDYPIKDIDNTTDSLTETAMVAHM